MPVPVFCSLVFLYTLFVRFYGLVVWLASVANPKARLWVQGRRGMKLYKPGTGWVQATEPASNQETYWFHCASLGEFEQGRPLMEALKQQHAECSIVVSFFSPSGFEVRKNWPGADFICYLPLDTPANARRFLKKIKPARAFFVKYEFWYHQLACLNRLKVPTYLVAASFRPGQPFFRWYGGLHRKMLGMFTHIFLQNDASAKLLGNIGINRFTVCGDPRFDRCLAAVSSTSALPEIAAFCTNDFTVVAGSTWEAEEELLLVSYKTTDHKLIIAPHDIGRAKSVQKRFEGSILYSQWLERNSLNTPELNALPYCLIMDNVGMLASLYQYASVVLVGGGFSGRLHNILEAAAWGKPVVFGSIHSRFPEAALLEAAGGGYSVADKGSWQQCTEILANEPAKRIAAGKAAAAFVAANAGSTQKMLTLINA